MMTCPHQAGGKSVMIMTCPHQAGGKSVMMMTCPHQAGVNSRMFMVVVRMVRMMTGPLRVVESPNKVHNGGCVATGSVLHILAEHQHGRCAHLHVLFWLLCNGGCVATGGVLHVPVEHRHGCCAHFHVLFPTAVWGGWNSLRGGWNGCHPVVAQQRRLWRAGSG